MGTFCVNCLKILIILVLTLWAALALGVTTVDQTHLKTRVGELRHLINCGGMIQVNPSRNKTRVIVSAVQNCPLIKLNGQTSSLERVGSYYYGDFRLGARSRPLNIKVFSKGGPSDRPIYRTHLPSQRRQCRDLFEKDRQRKKCLQLSFRDRHHFNKVKDLCSRRFTRSKHRLRCLSALNQQQNPRDSLSSCQRSFPQAGLQLKCLSLIEPYHQPRKLVESCDRVFPNFEDKTNCLETVAVAGSGSLKKIAICDRYFSQDYAELKCITTIASIGRPVNSYLQRCTSRFHSDRRQLRCLKRKVEGLAVRL